jgi:hypothetical protein
MQSKDPGNQRDQKKVPHPGTKEQMANHHNVSDDPASDDNCNEQGNIDSKMIDLNMRPVRTHGQGSNSQVSNTSILIQILSLNCPFVTPTISLSCINCSLRWQIQTQGADLSVNNHDSSGVVRSNNNYERDASK